MIVELSFFEHCSSALSSSCGLSQRLSSLSPTTMYLGKEKIYSTNKWEKMRQHISERTHVPLMSYCHFIDMIYQERIVVVKSFQTTRTIRIFFRLSPYVTLRFETCNLLSWMTIAFGKLLWTERFTTLLIRNVLNIC